jgi:formiminotetrahydrofolate cyclodeaminase
MAHYGRHLILAWLVYRASCFSPMTEVIAFPPTQLYHECMRDFGTWLRDLTEKPLPGGVSAAALASAMGTGLLAKAARVNLQRQDLSEEDRTALQAALDLACDQQPALLSLAEADERAYRAVLESRARGHETPAKGDVWREATEVPLCVAEACHLLLRQLPELQELCWPPIEPDLQVGQWLLEVGLRAGLAAAESNLRAWSGEREFVPFQVRVDALKQAIETR